MGNRRLALGGLALFLLAAACSEPTYRQTQNFDRPVDLAMACYRASSDGSGAFPIAVAACLPGRHLLYGFVPNAERGDVAVIDVLQRENVDLDPAIPGYTRAPVGSVPAVAVVHPSSRYVFTVNRGSSDLSRLTTASVAPGRWPVATQALPARPYDMVIGPAPELVPLALDDTLPEVQDGESEITYLARLTEWEDALTAQVDAIPWVGYVSAPAAGLVLIIPLDDTFGTLTGSAIRAIPLSGGAPQRLSLSPDGTTLFVTHIDREFVSAVDLRTGAEERLWLGPACGNGNDDDGDGLVDAADPGCTEAADDDERDPEAGPTCTNGLDDDGDGRTDADDPGCGDDPAVWACQNGLDDDGDGLTDMADGGCRRPQDASEQSDEVLCEGAATHPGCAATAAADRTIMADTSCTNHLDDDGDGKTDAEDADDCPVPGADGERRPDCGDGVDSDGDGEIDFPSDPGCFARDGASEVGPSPRDVAAAVASPDGAFLYVLDRTGRELHVFTWPEGQRVDVLATSATAGGHPVLRRLGQRGIPLASAPQDLGFVVHPNEGLTAYAIEATGLTTVVEARHPGVRCPGDETTDPYRFPPRDFHRLASLTSEPTASTISQPVLLRGEDEIDLAFAVIPSFPSLGPFRVIRRDQDTPTTPEQVVCDDGTVYADPYAVALPDEERTWYGIELRDDVRVQQSETWTVRYEGVVPGTSRIGALADGQGLFHDPSVDYCGAGVEAGDVLVLVADGPFACASGADGATVTGERFEWPIAEVRADTLVLAGPGRAYARPGDDVDPELELPDFVEVAADLPLPSLACFGGPVSYEIRVKDQYTVIGSRSGFLHNWVADGGRCVVRADADPLFTGRATEARVRADATLTCPPTEQAYEQAFDGAPFENHAFRFRIYPGCRRDAATGVTALTESERDVAWRFSVTSGFLPRQLSTGLLPGRIETLARPGYRRAFVADPSGEAVFEIDADLDTQAVAYTFF